MCQEHGASLHELAASIRDGAVRHGFAPDEQGALTADLLGDAMDENAEDYLGLVAVILDVLSEDVQRIVFEGSERIDGLVAEAKGTFETPNHSRFARLSKLRSRNTAPSGVSHTDPD